MFNSSEDNLSLKTFAANALEGSLNKLLTEKPHQETLNIEDYLSKRKLLVRSLLTGCWFGSLYDKERRLEFRNPWLDIEHGISELQTLWLLQQQLALLEDKPEKLVNWLANKVESLLVAINSSFNIALSIEPYWHE